LENSLFQAVTYVQRIQANMTNMNSIALTEPHESLHFLLTQALSHKKTMKEKMIIDVLNKLTTDIEQLSRKNSFVNLYPFIERFVFPIINTNVTLTTMLYSTCGAYGNSCEFLNDHKMLTIQANDVRHTKQLMEQILLSSDIKRKCPYCKDDTTPRTFHNAILICPKVIFVFKTQNSDIDKNLSYLEHINFNTYLGQNLVCVKCYSIYRLVSTVYEKEPNEYGAIAYCKDLKYHGTSANKTFIVSKKNKVRCLQTSSLLIYQKVIVLGVDFLNAVVAAIDRRNLLSTDITTRDIYSFGEFVDAVKIILSELAKSFLFKVRAYHLCSFDFNIDPTDIKLNLSDLGLLSP
ncbi:unnamed protein product, partial [Didymodactylos carnosus]